MKSQNKYLNHQSFFKLATLCGQFFLFINCTNLAASLPSCLNHPELPRSECFKEWSILIYMAADNDLSPYALWDIYEMEKLSTSGTNLGASNDKIDVVVELDTIGNSGVSLYHIEQGLDYYNLEISIEDFIGQDESMISSPLIAHYSEEIPSTAQSRLNHFLDLSYKNFPSEKVMLVIWGHGEGFLGSHYNRSQVAVINQENKLQYSPLFDKDLVSVQGLNFLNLNSIFPHKKVFGGVAFDDSDESFLNISEISEVIKKNNSHYRQGKALDILAFDACLMQSFEVADTLKNDVQFLVGSNQIQNYMGLPYYSLLNALNKKNISAYEIAKQIPQLVEVANNLSNSKSKFSAEDLETYTASTLSLSELNLLLIPALNNLRDAIKEFTNERILREIDLQFILENSPTFRGETRDTGIFIGTLLKMIYLEEEKEGQLTPAAAKLKQFCNQTLDALNRVTIASSYGKRYYDPSVARVTAKNNYLLGFFKGISIWLPSEEKLYRNRKEEFKSYPLLFKPKFWE